MINLPFSSHQNYPTSLSFHTTLTLMYSFFLITALSFYQISQPKPLTKAKIEESKKKLDKLDRFDKKRVQLLEKKNT